MLLFYTPKLDFNLTSFVLDEAESKHIIKVLRLTINDKITLTNGKGFFFEAEISNSNPKKCEVKILSHTKENNLKPTIHIAIAPTKSNERLEWFIEKATEIGVTEITPIICQHSERKNLKIDRLEKTAISAMKQSLKATLPTINNAITFDNFVKKYSNEKNVFIAHCINNTEKHLITKCTKNVNAIVLIGPEGDFTKEELKLAIKNNFNPVSLGKSRLRTETAGVISCHTINLLNE